jgi:predicted glutamine amidotransferase
MCRLYGFLATEPTRLECSLVASEPLTDENWIEVPEASVLGVEPGAHTLTRDLLATAA